MVQQTRQAAVTKQCLEDALLLLLPASSEIYIRVSDGWPAVAEFTRQDKHVLSLEGGPVADSLRLY